MVSATYISKRKQNTSVCLASHHQTSPTSPSWRPPLKSILYTKERSGAWAHVPLGHHSSVPSRGYWSTGYMDTCPIFLIHPQQAVPLRKQLLTAHHVPTFVQSHTNYNLFSQTNTRSSGEIRVTLRNAREGRRNSEHRLGSSHFITEQSERCEGSVPSESSAEDPARDLELHSLCCFLPD